MVESKKIISIGWCEWVSLPHLGIPALKAKVDTGAKTSSLHTFMIRTFTVRGQLKVCFGIHPLQKRTDVEVYCIADVIDERVVTNSGGGKEKRFFIKTTLQIGNMEREVELNLTRRETMRFRMLLGRTSMRDDFLVVPSTSCVLGKKSLADAYDTCDKLSPNKK